MRKLPKKLENPIDNLIYLFVEPHSKQLDFLTPNAITSISFIFCILTIYYYVQGKYKLSALFYILSYFYDCVDGYHARRKNMVSTFGDYYDHLTDIILNFGMGYLLAKTYSKTKYFSLISIGMFIITCGMYFHFGCQEHYYNNKDEYSYLLNMFNLCKKNPEKKLSFSRFFGSGTVILINTILILLSNKI